MQHCPKREQAVRDETMAIAEAVQLLKRLASKEVTQQLYTAVDEEANGSPANKAMRALELFALASEKQSAVLLVGKAICFPTGTASNLFS